jgi:hypothetical protein
MAHIRINTGNPLLEEETVTVQAVADLNPSRQVLSAITPGLKAVRGFRQIATTPVRHFTFDLGTFETAAKAASVAPVQLLHHLTVDKATGLFGERPHPNVLARVPIPPKHFSTFTFTADLSGAHRGDAHVFHLTQLRANRQPDGGLTVAIVGI